MLGYKKLVGIDIETSSDDGRGSLDPITGKIALVQIAEEVDGKTVVNLYRPWDDNFGDVVRLLEDKSVLKIGHNLKFDLSFFYMNNVFPEPVFDTMVASQVLYSGNDSPDDISEVLEAIKSDMQSTQDWLIEVTGKKKIKTTRFSHSLQACLKREINIFLPKDVQHLNWLSGLSEAQKEYAINDVKYLIPLARTLWRKLKSFELEKIIDLEMKFLKVMVMLELTGVKIDKKGWTENIEKEKKELEKIEKDLKLNIYKNFVKKENQLSLNLFDEDSFNANKINLNSSLQMAKIFGLNDVSKLTLQKLDNPIIKKYEEYKKKAKVVSTYAKEYLEKLDFNERIHSSYSQTRTATGRISSSSPNLQNVPPWFKKYIRAEDGYISVFVDYSQVELRILAYLSGDEKMIESCNSTDIHSSNARKIFNIPENEPVPSDLRKKAKTVSFAIPYGSSASGLVMRGMFNNLEEAEETIKLFYDKFPKVKEFLESSANKAEKGLTRDAIGRTRRYDVPYISHEEEDAYKMIREITMNSSIRFDDEIKEIGINEFAKKYSLKKKYIDLALSYIDKRRRINKIRREGQNHPIQATSASITKTAMVDLLNFLSLTGYGYMTLTVHDSVFFEIKKDYIFEAVEGIKTIMENAGPKVFPGIITPVDIEIGEKIIKNCFNCGKEIEINRFELDYLNRNIIDYDYEKYICDNCVAKNN
jgi:DNA polymerase-1